MRIAALVPMRHDSQRVVGKNYRMLGGRPLYQHIVSTLLRVPRIDEVVIDTDSPVILKQAALDFPTVTLLRRPDHLRDGMTPMNEVIANALDQIEADLYLQTHSTNPFLTADTISTAAESLIDQPHKDSLFSVTRFQARFWDANARAVNHDPSVLLRTQDLSPMFLENSCMYFFNKRVFQERGNRIGYSPLLFEIDAMEAVDIDEEKDFEFAETLVRTRSVDS